jgi:hypothetical protein
MARGDVITTSTTGVGAGAFTTFQPAAGDEWIVYHVTSDSFSADAAPNALPNITISSYDGTNMSNISSNLAQRIVPHLQLALSNTEYLRIKNESGGNATIGVMGFKTKE